MVRTGTRAFTLIELLVTITTICIVLGLLFPALRGARVTAQKLACDTNLQSIGKLTFVSVQQNGEEWPNVLRPGVEYRIFRLGTEYVINAPLEQVPLWMGILELQGAIDIRERATARAMSCPAIWAWMDEPEHRENPHSGPLASYAYSAGFVTSPGLWRIDDPTPRRIPGAHRHVNRSGDVLFPSLKALYFEKVDAHDTGLFTGDPRLGQGKSVGMVAADGHAARVRLADTKPVIATEWNLHSDFGLREHTPMASTRDGIRGRDLE
ncbi:MAG: type II secretion system protein [Phycisphaerales bacterium]|nr:type II secretion system protein [Phycisphaerales bacterium]